MNHFDMVKEIDAQSVEDGGSVGEGMGFKNRACFALR
jgi:hypothetical protein